MNWILFGFKGSGKSYFGSRLGLPFLDTDTLIEQKEGMTIRQLCQQKGEPYFRQIEKALISNLQLSGYLIAVGGGSLLDEENLLHLQRLGSLIYLDCPKELVKKRHLTPPLPTFLDLQNPEASFEKLYSTRIGKYEKIPSHRIQLEGKSDQQVLEELWQVINSARSSASPLGESLMAEL